MDPLPRRQRQTLQLIRDLVRKTGLAPTVRELARLLRCSSSATVHQHLLALVKKGYLTAGSRTHRGLVLTSKASAFPLWGKVAAGAPRPAEGLLEDDFDPSQFFERRGDEFVLHVRGDSMQGAGILNGDVVVVKPAAKADPRDIVVALQGTEATVKRLVKQGGAWWLMPENPRVAPIPMTEDTRILGVVKGVMRRY